MLILKCLLMSSICHPVMFYFSCVSHIVMHHLFMLGGHYL